MVEQILSLSLEKRKDIRLVIEMLSLNDLIEKIIEQQKIKSARPFHVRISFCPKEITLKADRIHLYSIISNLVDNAVKYADKESEIEIKAEAADGNVRICIQDNGPVIPEEYPPQGNLFYNYITAITAIYGYIISRRRSFAGNDRKGRAGRRRLRSDGGTQRTKWD